ncbi:MAG TPA: hypothetical protein VK574_20255 [Terracidiphilus sp.]|jgi:hypothetical protein|nr:hypothetical protein [Terracidiphilus sp.]
MKRAFLKMYQSALVALLFAMLPVFLLAQEHDENSAPVRYSTASLCGNYGAVAVYGANVARALGFEVMDGHGKITGAAFVNQPGPNNTRTVANIGISGTYSIDAEGMGTMSLTIALPGGGTANVTEDFVITKSKAVDGVEIATEIQDAQEVPSAVIDDSSLVIHTYTLRGNPRGCSAHGGDH